MLVQENVSDLVEVWKTQWDVSEDYISAAEGYNLFKGNRSKWKGGGGDELNIKSIHTCSEIQGNEPVKNI